MYVGFEMAVQTTRSDRVLFGSDFKIPTNLPGLSPDLRKDDDVNNPKLKIW
jgi:predicted TIM-barrel fold metal-dependent hydrolase